MRRYPLTTSSHLPLPLQAPNPFSYLDLDPEHPRPPRTGGTWYPVGPFSAHSVAEPANMDYLFSYFIYLSCLWDLCSKLKGRHGWHGDTQDIKLVVS